MMRNKLLFVVFTFLLALPAHAITIAPPSISTDEILRSESGLAAQGFEYKEIVVLLQAGKRNEANLKIAKILTKRPADKTALELAGITLLQMKKFAAAEESFRRLVSLPPVKPSVVTNYGVAKILNGNIAGGVKLLEQVLKYTPKDAIAIRYLAWVAEKNGKTQAAIQYLEKLPQPSVSGLREHHVELASKYDARSAYAPIVKLLSPVLDELGDKANPIETEAALYLSSAYAALGEKKKAQKLAGSLEKHIESDPVKLFLLNIRMASMDERPDAANKLVKQYLVKFPESEAFARYHLARVYLHQEDTIGAIEQLDIVLSKVSENEAIGTLKVMLPIFLQESMYSQAIKTLSKVSQKYPNNDVIKYNLAEVQSVAGRKPEALNTLKELIDREKPFEAAYLLAGGISRELKKLKESISYLNSFTQLQPNNVQGWISLGGSYYDQGRYQKAIGYLKEGRTHSPKSARLSFEIASVYQAIGNIDRANEAYRQAIQFDQNHIEAMDNLASNLLDSNQELDTAKAYAEKVYRKFPNDPYIKDLWGWALLRTGQSNEALPYLEGAADGIENSGRGNYHLGLAYIETKQPQKAAEEFKTALKKGVDNTTRREIEKYLK